MATSRRAERERNSGVLPAEHVEPTGNITESERSEQQQPNLSDENRIPIVEPTTAVQPDQSRPRNSNRTSGNRGRGTRVSSESKERNRERRTENSEKSKEGIAVLLAGIHSFGAKMVNECLELDESEAIQMADALHRVNELYSRGILSPKVAAWGNLVMCFGQVYIPRAMILLKSSKTKKPVAQIVPQKGSN